MAYTTEFFIRSTKASLAAAERDYKEVIKEDYVSDDLPKEIVIAIHKGIIYNCQKALEYLATLPIDKVLSTDRGSGEEMEKYYKIINS